MTEMKRKSEHSLKPLARYDLRAGRAAHGEQTAVVMAKIWRPAPGPLGRSQPYLGVSSAPDERGNLYTPIHNIIAEYVCVVRWGLWVAARSAAAHSRDLFCCVNRVVSRLWQLACGGHPLLL